MDAIIPPVRELPPAVVHLWAVTLTASPAALAACLNLLAPDELHLADQHREEKIRARSVAARGCLRILLGSYLATDPAAIRFASNRFGKPALTGAAAASGIQFNLAHADDCCLYAFARGRAVGIDVENHARPLEELAGIAARVFPPATRAALAALPPAAQRREFFRQWTRTEAVLKGRGEGFSTPAATDALEDSRWEIRELAPAPGYHGALAVERRGEPVRVVTMPTLTADAVVNNGWSESGKAVREDRTTYHQRSRSAG